MMKRIHLLLCLLAAVLICPGMAAASGGDAETLTLTGGDIQSLAELSEYPNLQSLALIDCPVYDLAPLTGCTKLTSLTIRWSEGFVDIGTYDLASLKQCARLNTLTLAGQGIADISALPSIPKLSVLAVEKTAVTDYSPIETLSLKHLRLYGVDSSAVTRIFSAVGRRLESASVGGCALTPEANNAILSGTRLISLGFTDAEGIDGESARWQKLKYLSCLSVTGGSVSSLRFCETYVSTVGVKMTDVSVGGAVCSLDFDKYFLKTADVPEAELLNLTQGGGRRWQYAIVRNEGEPYSPAVVEAFAGGSGLLSLDIQALSADAFTPEAWGGFPKLEQLKLSDCPSVDLDMLPGIPALLRLSVRNAAVQSAARIADLRKLQQLSLSDCTVTDWSFLNAMGDTKLSLLSLSGCDGPASVAFVKDLPKLKVLALEYAPVTDISPLTGLAVETLSLYGCDIADYTPLETLTSLTRLYCSEGAALPALSGRVVHRPAIAAE